MAGLLLVGIPWKANAEAGAPASSTGTVLWYRAPAQDWERQALPIGNGSLGGMVFGGVEKERVQFNEDSLWTGDGNPSGNYRTMGAYQAFGDLYLELSHGKAESYRRQLHIGKAIVGVAYTSNGVHYRREYFSSYSDQVMVIRLTAGKRGNHSGGGRRAGALRTGGDRR